MVLAALDDAIADDKKYGNGPEQIARWARSRDGREVLTCAGIDPNERVVSGLMDFVSKGVRTSVALTREESERRQAAEQPRPPDRTIAVSHAKRVPTGRVFAFQNISRQMKNGATCRLPIPRNTHFQRDARNLQTKDVVRRATRTTSISPTTSPPLALSQ